VPSPHLSLSFSSPLFLLRVYPACYSPPLTVFSVGGAALFHYLSPRLSLSLSLSLFVSLPLLLSSPPLSTVKPRFLLRRAESSVFITLSVPDRILQADSQTHKLAVIVAAITSLHANFLVIEKNNRTIG